MKPAAFQATFTDWRLIKGRKVVQIVFEVSIEAADAAYHVLGGMPDPGASVWCAVARLITDERKVVSHALTDTPNATATEKPALPAAPAARVNRLTRLAGICCNDARFWRFLTEHEMPVRNNGEAATAVRLICHVGSRREIISGTQAGDAWDELYSKFVAWRDAPEQAA